MNYGIRSLAILSAIVSLATSGAQADVLFVHAGATGADDGSSWTDAFTDLEDALADAAGSGGVITELWVATGTCSARAPGDVALNRHRAGYNPGGGKAFVGLVQGGQGTLPRHQRIPARVRTRLVSDYNSSLKCEKEKQTCTDS